VSENVLKALPGTGFSFQKISSETTIFLTPPNFPPTDGVGLSPLGDERGSEAQDQSEIASFERTVS
jgi:hypothetical protein